MSIFCRKKINSLNNKVLSYHFFFVFKFVMKNPLLSYPYFVKNVNSVKNYTMVQDKKVNRMPFFSYFSRKKKMLSCHFVKKRPFSKNIPLSSQYFVEKMSILSKTRCFMSFASNFSLKNPCCHVHIWSKKYQFSQNCTILWAKKVNYMPFLSEKCQKRPYNIYQKNQTPLQNTL